jgi:ADP-heptose:LPS heptosyltransferase
MMEPSRILFIAEGQLGDLLVVTPAIRAIKRTYPQSSVSVLIFQRRPYFRDSSHQPKEYLKAASGNGASSVFLQNPNTDTVIEVDSASLQASSGWYRIKAEAEIIADLRRRKFDTVIVAPRDRFVLWAFASGASIRVGQLHQVYHQLLTHRPDVHKSDAGVVRYYCALAESIGVKTDSYETEFYVPPTAQERAWAFLHASSVSDSRTLIGIHPGAYGSDRIWPPERFARLIDILQSAADTKILLFGGTYDNSVIERIIELANTNPLIVRTGSDISLLGALLQKCVLFVGNDSGPRHLAAAVGTRTLALLARNTQFEWDAYDDKDRHCILQGQENCPTCPQRLCHNTIPDGEQFGSHCMRMISVETVSAKIREMLNG